MKATVFPVAGTSVLICRGDGAFQWSPPAGWRHGCAGSWRPPGRRRAHRWRTPSPSPTPSTPRHREGIAPVEVGAPVRKTRPEVPASRPSDPARPCARVVVLPPAVRRARAVPPFWSRKLMPPSRSTLRSKAGPVVVVSSVAWFFRSKWISRPAAAPTMASPAGTAEVTWTFSVCFRVTVPVTVSTVSSRVLVLSARRRSESVRRSRRYRSPD